MYNSTILVRELIILHENAERGASSLNQLVVSPITSGFMESHSKSMHRAHWGRSVLSKLGLNVKKLWKESRLSSNAPRSIHLRRSSSWMCSYVLLILEFGRLRQEDHAFEVSPGYIIRPYLKYKQNKRERNLLFLCSVSFGKSGRWKQIPHHCFSGHCSPNPHQTKHILVDSGCLSELPAAQLQWPHFPLKLCKALYCL